MSSGFPADNAPLTNDTFDTCYNVLLTQIHQETAPTTSGNGNDGTMNLSTLHTGDAFVALDKWHTYATDGDLSRLPSTGGAATPWDYLAQTRAGKLTSDTEQLSGVHDQLFSKWSGSAAQEYAQYMQTMSKHLDNYSTPNGYLDQVAALLKAAVTVEVAFKKDLLESARAASKSLDALEHGQAGGDIALFCVGLAGLALSGMGAVAAGASVAGFVFVNATVGSVVGGLSFNELKDRTVAIDGDSPTHIMANLDSAVGKIVAGYQQAAKQVSDKMDDLSRSLTAEASGITGVANVPVVDTTGTSSFNLNSFFPVSANGNNAVQAKIGTPAG
jgi:uncharacterized protein YukE